MSVFPGSIDSFTTVSAGDLITASMTDDQNAATVAIETVLGTNPQGSASTVRDNIAAKAAVADVQTDALIYAADIGSADAYEIVLSPAPPAYTAGQMVIFTAANANTGASTLIVNSQAAQALVGNGGATLSAGDILAGQVVAAIYDGTQFQMVGSVATSLLNRLPNTVNEFRLTVMSGLPISTDDTDNTAYGTSIYFTPYTGNRVALYDGTSTWSVFTTSEISIDVSTLATGVYDLFLYNASGTPTLEVGPMWTDFNDRSTAIVLQDGVYVNSADTTRRYVGTFWTDGSTTYDVYWNRALFNADNRTPHFFGNVGGTGSTNSNGWGTFISANFLVGLTAEGIFAWGGALGQGDGISAAAEITLGYNGFGPDPISAYPYPTISAIVGTSTLQCLLFRTPGGDGPPIGYTEIDLLYRSSVDMTTVNFLDDGIGTNLTYLYGIVWV
jgi:hypothetical protein